MSKKSWNIIWFKKDLRVADHQPLLRAAQAGPCIAVFFIEPEWEESPEFSEFQYAHLIESLRELEEDLAKLNISLIVLHQNALAGFKLLSQNKHLNAVYSHQETGLWWTYQRDLKCREWFKEKSIHWQEFLQFSVHRKLVHRDLWNKKRVQTIQRKIWPPPQPKSLENIVDLRLDKQLSIQRHDYNITEGQMGGRSIAIKTLSQFLAHRGKNYTRQMSSPNTAFTACSRISPYLSFGSLSLTEVHHALISARKKLNRIHPAEVINWTRSYKSFESRLWWHCHFIQKLETEPEIEFQNMNRSFDGLRESEFNQDYFEAWCKGETGFPIIDACMRCLHQTGWINFRMRALLVSFASYQLWLDWRKTSTYLATLFTDFEPGIHYSQFQMQSGVTGINAIRIYSSIKQSMDQDPEGDFIRTYVPELAEVDKMYIHEPQLIPPLLQQMIGVVIGRDYPAPIVDHKKAYNLAKERIFNYKSQGNVRKASKKVYQKHGSRKHKSFPKQNRGIQ